MCYAGASILGGGNILLKGPCINLAPPIIKLQHTASMSICHKSHEMPLCLNCPKFGQLIIRKIIRVVATIDVKFWGTPFEELTALPLTTWLHLRGPISKGRWGKEKGRVNEGEKEGRKRSSPQSSPQIDATCVTWCAGIVSAVNFFLTIHSFSNCFYRAMHFSAKRGIAIACRLSVCLSVCLSVTLVNCDHIGWNSSKVISPLVSLGCSLFATPNMTGLLQGEHP